MPGVRRPGKPKSRIIPKIKKPSISKAKKLKKKPATISVRKPKKTKTQRTVKPNPLSKKKHVTTRRQTGTCYLRSGCRTVLAREMTKIQCKKIGGKSWKKTGGICEKLIGVL